MKIIDPHLHLFDLKMGQYTWLKPNEPPIWSDKPLIAKDFSERDLPLTYPLSLGGFVHIEAGFDNQQPWREIAWLARTCQLPFRSVAMLDITLPKAEFAQQLQQLLQYKSVVGIRYILDNDAKAILTDKNSQHNLNTLAENQLSFELQMPLSNCSAVNKLIDILIKTPTLMVAINHAGWPPLPNDTNNTWLKNLRRLASFNQIYIKCSGFEMAERAYSLSWQALVISQCIEYFGVNRVMLASNFPLCLLRESYQSYWCAGIDITNNLLSGNAAQLQHLCFNNAETFYKFS